MTTLSPRTVVHSGFQQSRMTTILHDLLISLILISHLSIASSLLSFKSGRQWVCSKQVNGQSFVSLYQLRTCISGHLGCWVIHNMVGTALLLRLFASFYVPRCPFMSQYGITMVTKMWWPSLNGSCVCMQWRSSLYLSHTSCLYNIKRVDLKLDSWTNHFTGFLVFKLWNVWPRTPDFVHYQISGPLQKHNTYEHYVLYIVHQCMTSIR